jgi:phosphatidylserine/phosphatidylglycerophosphate/cardiolipin synthase-like enzyme
MLSRHVVELCTSPATLTAALAKDPCQPVSKIVKQLSKNCGAKFKEHVDTPPFEETDELDLAAKCGSFPHRPSDLFLRVYKDVLGVLKTEPLAGLVSPSLLGSSGVVPLTIVSVIPDISRHYAKLIARAEAEVLFATNYWERSQSSAIIADSLRELSTRVQARGGEKVVVKLMYDRGNVKQALKNRIVVKPIYWTRIGLPAQDEIPGVALEVINYHRALLGTFHAKYLVVDRRVVCLNSNNIQDRPNIEMMIQLEGPVVESFYDMALMSWAIAMNPRLPLLSIPPAHPDVYKFKQDNEDMKYIGSEPMFAALRAHFQDWRTVKKAQRMRFDNPPQPQRTSSTTDRRHGDAIPMQLEAHVLSPPETTDARDLQSNTNTNEFISASTWSSPVPDRSSHGVDNGLVSSSENAELLDAGEVDCTAQSSDDDFLDDFFPHILHEPHKPVPIAMVNRGPTGTPGHYHVRQFPQNVAWLSAMHNAQKSVFIQTPTFNASPIVSSALDACRRGVQVTLYLDLGFNDQGEMIPFQGGTNEEVVHKMYRRLNREGKGAEKHLEVFWYTAKDQTKPLNAALRKRNCHVKFMAVDDQIAILGNGNQDTQSWFHSQEINVMIDSQEHVAAWMRCIEANQNTRLYGQVGERDGVLRGEDGEPIQASGVESSNFLRRLKGMGKVMSRVRGTGGF